MTRFASLDDVQFERIPVNKDAENTWKTTKMVVKILRNYSVEKGPFPDFDPHRTIFKYFAATSSYTTINNSSNITIDYTEF